MLLRWSERCLSFLAIEDRGPRWVRSFRRPPSQGLCKRRVALHSNGGNHLFSREPETLSEMDPLTSSLLYLPSAGQVSVSVTVNVTCITMGKVVTWNLGEDIT